MKVNTVVRMLRVQRYGSAAELAQKAGINILRYKRFESGIKYYHLKRDELYRIAVILRVPSSMFAQQDGSPKVLDDQLI